MSNTAKFEVYIMRKLLDAFSILLGVGIGFYSLKVLLILITKIHDENQFPRLGLRIFHIMSLMVIIFILNFFLIWKFLNLETIQNIHNIHNIHNIKDIQHKTFFMNF